MSRRAFLGVGGVVGASVVLAPRALTPTAMAATASSGPAVDLFADADLNFQVLFALGAIGQGMAEYGEVATVVDAIQARGASYDAVHDEFAAMSTRLFERATKSRREKHPVSARAQYLRSARYMTPALYFVLGTSGPTPMQQQRLDYRAMRRSWAAAARLHEPRIEPVRIPYGRTTMPGWFVRAPGARGRRPLVILNNGNDAQVPDIHSYGGVAALERGYHALIFEGPGQGGMLFLRGLPLRPDWERVLTPVVDYARRRGDVDPKRIAVIGWSEGGELVARALLHEHRVAAAVLDPGNLDELGAFHLPAELVDLVRGGQRDAANAEWSSIFPALDPATRFLYTKGALPFGGTDFYDTVRGLLRFELTAEQLGRIRTPTLVTAYEDENVYPGQAQQVYEALTARKDLVQFAAADGAQLHDAPMAPQTRNEAVFDWLDDALG